MTTKLTNREMELFRRVIHLAKEFEDSHPDVGFGPSLKTLAEMEAEKLSFSIDEDDITECCEYCKRGLRKHSNRRWDRWD